MNEHLITRRTLRRLLQLSRKQFDRLELDPHLTQFTARGKGGAIGYRLNDVEKHLKINIPFSAF